MIRIGKPVTIAIALTTAFALAGCNIDPMRFAPNSAANTASNQLSCSPPSYSALSTIPALKTDLDAQLKPPGGNAAPQMADEITLSKNHLTLLKGQVDAVADRAANLDQMLPKKLKGNTVIHSIADLLVYRHYAALKTIVKTLDHGMPAYMEPRDRDVITAYATAIASAPAADGKTPDDKMVHTKVAAVMTAQTRFMTPDDEKNLSDYIDQKMAAQKPASIKTYVVVFNNDFETLYQALIATHDSQQGDLSQRLMDYESDYFNGSFTDRFGTLYAKPALSGTVTDQEIANALIVFFEAVADEIFQTTPVWTGKDAASGKTFYYPGANANQPSFLAYATEQGATPLTLPLATDGCGMTALKAQALTYLSGKAATWASGESGLVVGATGGANLGPAVILGKLSIGDNKLLLTVIQSIFADAARRAVFEATIPVLLSLNQDKSMATVWQVLDQLTFAD